MPKPNTDPEQALEKLGQRIRAGYAKQNPAQNLESVREAVREQYEQEQQTPRASKPAPDAARKQERQPPEPDAER